MIVNCAWCGKPKRIPPSWVKRHKHHFCDLSCCGNWCKKNMAGEKSPSWKGGGIEKICNTCGIIFKARRSQVNRGRGSFCSYKCARIHFFKNKQKQNHPFWKGGDYVRTRNYILKNPDKFKAWKIIHTAIKTGEIKKGVCEVCGITRANAHHDDYTKPLNIRWLCYKHHNQYHRSIKNWGPLTKGLTFGKPF